MLSGWWHETVEPQRREEAVTFFRQGYERQMQGALDAAVVCYKKSLEIHPTAEAHTFLGWAYSFMGRYQAAIEECLKAIAVDPDFGNPYNDIGAYYVELGRLDDAIPWLEQATHAQRYESYCFPHYNLGRIWELRGHWQRAADAYRRSLAANPDYAPALQALRRIQGWQN